MSRFEDRTRSIAQSLAAFVARTVPTDIPGEVRVRAHHHMLDGVGIALASTRFDFAHKTLTALHGLAGPGEVPVIGLPAALPPRDAAVVNGLLIHGLDFDDTHMGGVIHPTASVMPAALSAGVMADASGAEVVTAYVLGVEAAARLGSVAQGGFHQVGFHPTGMVGVFACALVAGRLLGLGEKQLADAQGIALSLASGSLEFLADGAWTKRLHPGWAAAAGLTAAALAREGFVGASRPYEGRFGLYNAYLGTEAGRADLARATAGLGTDWELLATAVKPFPACHFTHASVDAALALADIVPPAEIAAVEVLVPPDVVKVVCEPAASKQRPANAYDAQFSIPYLVAAAMLRRRLTLAELASDALADPHILALAAKVAYRPDPRSPFPAAYSGEVVVTTHDGRVLRHREHTNRGALDRPLSDQEIVDKFRANAETAVGTRRAAAIEAAMLGLSEIDRVAPALRILSSARP